MEPSSHGWGNCGWICMDQISEHIRTLKDMQLSKAQANGKYLASSLDAVES